MHVGERCSLHPEEVFDPRLRGRKTRRLFVFDEIVCQEAAEPVDISGVQKVVEASRGSHMVLRVSSSEGLLQGSVRCPVADVYPPSWFSRKVRVVRVVASSDKVRLG